MSARASLSLSIARYALDLLLSTRWSGIPFREWSERRGEVGKEREREGGFRISIESAQTHIMFVYNMWNVYDSEV